MIILIAKFKTSNENREKMLNIAKEMLEPSNNEEGCISYEFFQNPFEKNYLIFVEKWQSKEDLELHFQTPHFKNFDSKINELLVEKPSVISYEVGNEITIL